MSITLLLLVRKLFKRALCAVLLTPHSCQRCRGYHHQRCADEPI